MKLLELVFLKIRLIYVKILCFMDKVRNPINKKLPKLLKLTRYGFVTTMISVILGTGLVLGAEEGQCTNLERYSGACLYTDPSKEKGNHDYFLQWVNKQFEGFRSYNETTGEYETKGGVIAAITNFDSAIFTNTDQVSGVRFLANTLEEAKIVSPAYAQATGYTTLQPVLLIWRKVRDIALTFMLIIGMVIAIMILLRVQSGQGYVTLISALPRIIMAILLIIFSYAIAGLMIDTGNLVSRFLVSRGLFVNEEFIPQGLLTHVIYSGPNNIKYPLDWDGALDEYNSGDPTTGENWKTMNIFRLMSGMTDFSNWGACRPNCNISSIIRVPTGYPIIDGGTEALEFFGEAPDALLEAILNIYLTILSLRIFFMLVQAFAELVIRTIAAPVQFLGIPLSGSKPFVDWLRGGLADSLCFPVSFLLMFLAAFFSNQYMAPWWFKQDLVVFNHAPEMLTHTVSSVQFVGNIIAVGILMMIPNVKKQLEQMLTVQGMGGGADASGLRGLVSKIPVVGSVAGFLGA
ncbi:MAG: hypothetical protein ABIE03_05260 [Patescibacteria group bacterium]|nr:hypothetical protein [Patescibacteria group bacterium]